MYNFATLARGIAARLLGSQPPQADGQDQAFRLSRYGDMFVESIFQKQMGLADEESTFATTGTIGTGIATIAALTAVVDTSPFIIVQNIDQAGGKRGYLDLLKLITTAPGTAGTKLQYAVKVGPSRAAPTGFDSAFGPATPVNVVGSSGRASILRVYAGALIAPAAAAGNRQIWGGQLKNAIPAIADQYLLSFGQVDAAAQATQVDRVESCPAVPIDPGYSAFIHLALPSQSAASSYEVAIIHHER